MTSTNWMRTLALAFMALSIVASGFEHVVPGWIAGYFMAGAGVFVGLAGLFTHPPGSLPDNPPPPHS